MKITALPPLSIDNRGYTALYRHERMGEHIIVFRKAGTISGRHYHKGIAPTKNPELFLLLSGTLLLTWRKPEETSLQQAYVNGPAMIEIPPYIWHEMLMQTDCTALELGSLQDHKDDTYL
jgi:dTDP-4-dehydrorhamnose 3,5-epimerase-like enzyme